MPPRIPCHPVSLYRLDGFLDLEDYLLSAASEDVLIDETIRLSEITCRVIAGVRHADKPTWATHLQSLTSLTMELPSKTPFAVLLVPLADHTYALTWGGGHHLLDDLLIHDGFGMLFGIRRLDSARLRTVARSALDATARLTQTSFPGGSDLGGFGLEPHGETVTRISGRADLTGLTYERLTGRPYTIKASSALYAPLAEDPEALLSDLRAIENVVAEPDDDSDLRILSQTRPLSKHHPMIPELERRLAAALSGDSTAGVIGTAWPADAIREIEGATSFKVVRLGPGQDFAVETTLDLDEIIDRFAALPERSRLDILGSARMVACEGLDGQDEYGRQVPLRKWLVFETTIDHVRYCHSQGKWFRIGEGYVTQIRDQVAALLRQRSDLTFPHWVPSGEKDDEHRYCELVAKQPGYLCLDRNFARTPMHPKFELCDIVGPNGELAHVKWLGRAAAASHLFTQAAVSAEAIRHEPDAALTELDNKVRALDPTRTNAEPSTIVLAVAGRTWDVDELFTLSQIGLLKLNSIMRTLRIRLEFADIPYTPKTKGSSSGMAA
ncbi:hypothetical protein SacmaDRAFT_3423 [Saccharomonospora marina XMU15]|uniref:Sporadically distributed protein, TIGR04141 family n=1 Tax=Saccharomonospora marina XMU15 TaxID=882083 RepID=H5XBR9_9PSEU|nr:TIGR04141 family sporadically distributed protein [Saccharomonospora marina]EHR51644.1 hypothetical protein SacmaDRAFT_3423 [Saccharomonospora marina XMU15]